MAQTIYASVTKPSGKGRIQQPNNKYMKTKRIILAVLALFLSMGAFAQSQPDVHIHKAKGQLTPEERTARRAEHKAKMASMTPTERKAFKQAHREQRQARLNAMTPEQRAKAEERRKLRKVGK
jgi:protein CpxP